MRQFVIAHEILNFQILNGNHIVAFNQFSGHFLQVIISDVSDLQLVLAFGLSQLLPIRIIILINLSFMLMIKSSHSLLNRCAVTVAMNFDA